MSLDTIRNDGNNVDYFNNWRHGVQRICEAFKKLGAQLLKYIVGSEDIMLKFTALESAKVTVKVTERGTEKVTNEVTYQDLIRWLMKGSSQKVPK